MKIIMAITIMMKMIGIPTPTAILAPDICLLLFIGFPTVDKNKTLH